MGHEDLNTINNLGSIFYFCIGNAFLWVLAAFIEKRKSKCFNRLKKAFKKDKQAQNLLFVFFEGYLEMLLASYLNSLFVINNTKSDTLANLFGYFITI